MPTVLAYRQLDAYKRRTSCKYSLGLALNHVKGRKIGSGRDHNEGMRYCSCTWRGTLLMRLRACFEASSIVLHIRHLLAEFCRHIGTGIGKPFTGMRMIDDPALIQNVVDESSRALLIHSIPILLTSLLANLCIIFRGCSNRHLIFLLNILTNMPNLITPPYKLCQALILKPYCLHAQPTLAPAYPTLSHPNFTKRQARIRKSIQRAGAPCASCLSPRLGVSPNHLNLLCYSNFPSGCNKR